jgi:hypothetical protein
MSGPQRLAAFLAFLWIGFWFLAYMFDPVFRWDGFFLFGVAPVAVIGGAWWVINGFRKGGAR